MWLNFQSFAVREGTKLFVPSQDRSCSPTEDFLLPSLFSLLLILPLEIFYHYSIPYKLNENHLKSFEDEAGNEKMKERDGGRGRDRCTRAITCCLEAKIILLITSMLAGHRIDLFFQR